MRLPGPGSFGLTGFFSLQALFSLLLLLPLFPCQPFLSLSLLLHLFDLSLLSALLHLHLLLLLLLLRLPLLVVALLACLVLLTLFVLLEGLLPLGLFNLAALQALLIQHLLLSDLQNWWAFVAQILLLFSSNACSAKQRDWGLHARHCRHGCANWRCMAFKRGVHKRIGRALLITHSVGSERCRVGIQQCGRWQSGDGLLLLLHGALGLLMALR